MKTTRAPVTVLCSHEFPAYYLDYSAALSRAPKTNNHRITNMIIAALNKVFISPSPKELERELFVLLWLS